MNPVGGPLFGVVLPTLSTIPAQLYGKRDSEIHLAGGVWQRLLGRGFDSRLGAQFR